MKREKRGGFTLVELMIGISISVLVIGVALSLLMSVNRAAYEVTNTINLVDDATQMQTQLLYDLRSVTEVVSADETEFTAKIMSYTTDESSAAVIHEITYQFKDGKLTRIVKNEGGSTEINRKVLAEGLSTNSKLIYKNRSGSKSSSMSKSDICAASLRMVPEQDPRQAKGLIHTKNRPYESAFVQFRNIF